MEAFSSMGATFCDIPAIWPAPPGHKVSIQREQFGNSISVEISDLVAAGLLHPGQVLHSNPGKYAGHTATVLSDGRLEMAGKVYESPSRAGIAVRQKHTNGWYFWRVDQTGKTSLAELRDRYLSKVSPGDGAGTDEDSGA